MIQGFPDGIPRIVDFSFASSVTEPDHVLPGGPAYKVDITASTRYRETKKNTQYAHLVNNIGYKFLPFVTNGMGYWGDPARQLISAIRDNYAQHNFISISQASTTVYGFLWSTIYQRMYWQISRARPEIPFSDF